MIFARRRTVSGFTLIEVVVALAILGWVLGSAVFLVSQYADERIRLRERFLGNQVAWNQLMEEYRFSRGWRGRSASRRLQEGVRQQAGQDWPFTTTIEEAAGTGLYRYQVTALAPGSENIAGSMSLFLQQTGAQPGE